MRKSSLIGHVVELHEAVGSTGAPADNVVKDFFRRRHYLGSKDRRFITNVLYSIIRHQKLLQTYTDTAYRLTGSAQTRGRIPSLALYAAYAIKLLNETAESVVADLAGLARVYMPNLGISEFLSALQAATLPSAVTDDPLRRIATLYSLPEFVVGEWLGRFAEAETELLCESLNQAAPITIRVNTLRTTVEECQLALLREGVECRRTTLSPCALILSKRVNIHALESFRRGYFEMQDEGSQLLSMLLAPLPGERVVDACAGGGGKTLHIAALMNNSGELLAVDVDEQRLRNVRERIERAGVSIASVYLSGRDQEHIDRWLRKADRVMVDAPCTGVGVFRRNPAAKLSLTEEIVERLSSTQRSVLHRYAEFVRPGGRLVYATCSLLKRENENIVEWFLESHRDFSFVPGPDVLRKQGVPFESTSQSVTLLPHKTSSDGFFAAVMVREK